MYKSFASFLFFSIFIQWNVRLPQTNHYFFRKQSNHCHFSQMRWHQQNGWLASWMHRDCNHISMFNCLHSAYLNISAETMRHHTETERESTKPLIPEFAKLLFLKLTEICSPPFDCHTSEWKTCAHNKKSI